MVFNIEKKSQDVTNKDDEWIVKLASKPQTLNDDLNKDYDLLKDADAQIKKLDSEFIKSEQYNSNFDDQNEINSSTASKIRKDKTFKNVFRAPKKYFLSLFKAHSMFFKTISKSERKKIAHSELETFVQTYFIDKDCTKTLDGLTMNDLICLVGRIVIPEYMTKKNNSYIYRKECEIYHNWIYKFNVSFMNRLSEAIYNFMNYINFH